MRYGKYYFISSLRRRLLFTIGLRVSPHWWRLHRTAAGIAFHGIKCIEILYRRPGQMWPCEWD